MPVRKSSTEAHAKEMRTNGQGNPGLRPWLLQYRPAESDLEVSSVHVIYHLTSKTLEAVQQHHNL